MTNPSDVPADLTAFKADPNQSATDREKLETDSLSTLAADLAALTTRVSALEAKVGIVPVVG